MTIPVKTRVEAHRARMSSKGYKRAEYQSDAPTASRIASLARYWGVSSSEATRICVLRASVEFPEAHTPEAEKENVK